MFLFTDESFILEFPEKVIRSKHESLEWLALPWTGNSERHSQITTIPVTPTIFRFPSPNPTSNPTVAAFRATNSPRWECPMEVGRSGRCRSYERPMLDRFLPGSIIMGAGFHHERVR